MHEILIYAWTMRWIFKRWYLNILFLNLFPFQFENLMEDVSIYIWLLKFDKFKNCLFIYSIQIEVLVYSIAKQCSLYFYDLFLRQLPGRDQAHNPLSIVKIEHEIYLN